MTVLNDKSIRSLVEDKGVVDTISDSRMGTKNSQVQPSSLDLTVGSVRIPGDDEKYPEVTLQAGHTVIVTTKERLRVPTDTAVITFSPVQQSVKGILILNQGHVDPGYDGYLHFIVINMSNKSIPLQEGNIISSLLFFKLDGDCHHDYKELNGAHMDPEISGKMLDRFSPDFLDVGSRVDEKIEAQRLDDKIENKFNRLARERSLLENILIGLGVAILSFVFLTGTFEGIGLYHEMNFNAEKIKDMQTELNALRDRLDQQPQ